MFGTPVIRCDDGADRCPFVGSRCPWPCPPNCQCPGECPMDVAESEDAVRFGAVDTTDYGHPFPGATQSWPCSSSCQCAGGCAMDVDESDATTTGRDATDVDPFAYAGQPYLWPYTARNDVREQQCDATDFTASHASYGEANAPGDGHFASADGQFPSWPAYSVANGVRQAQGWSDDGPAHGNVADDDMCLVGDTTDYDSGNESDSSGGVIVIV